MKSDIIILGLGSNVGDRMHYLRDAVSILRTMVKLLACSPIYESNALLPEGAPPEWNTPFLNMALRATTTLRPDQLLERLKEIEVMVGRQDRGHWGPREIDIDILAYGNRVMSDDTLTLPHRELLQRDFALIPFADIAGEWIYPVADRNAGKTARALADAMPKTARYYAEPLT